LQISTYVFDVIMTSYYAYGLYQLLFKAHECNNEWSLNYINMMILLIIVSPKVAVYIVGLTTIIMFLPCIAFLVYSYFKNRSRQHNDFGFFSRSNDNLMNSN
jgi:hypothetical protein